MSEYGSVGHPHGQFTGPRGPLRPLREGMTVDPDNSPTMGKEYKDGAVRMMDPPGFGGRTEKYRTLMISFAG